MIIPQSYPLGAIAPDGKEYLVIGWYVATDPNRVAVGPPRAILAGTTAMPAFDERHGWRLTQDVPIPHRPVLTDLDWTEVRLCETPDCAYFGIKHAGRCLP